MLYRIRIAMNGVRTLVVICTDCTCSCKSNYHTIMTTTVLLVLVSQTIRPSTRHGLNEWLLFNVTKGYFQPYHDENKLHFDEMMMSRCTRQTRLVGLYKLSTLKQQSTSTGRHVDALGQIILVPSQNLVLTH
jgi:hypothetical protein